MASLAVVAIAEVDSTYLVATVSMVVAIAGCTAAEVVGHTVVAVVEQVEVVHR